jgi:hypothetical protein
MGDMRMLSAAEMEQIGGGDLDECGVLGVTTALSCVTGLIFACGLGGVGYALLC